MAAGNTVDEALVLQSPAVERWATISEDRRYRYNLGRRWNRPVASRIVWVMLNPSTADACVDDPTIRRCMAFSRAWGHDEMVVVNLYALRATDPSELGRATNPFGSENARYIDRHLASAALVVAAWGAHPWATQVADATLGRHRPLYCLGRTKAGHPRHPLYVPRAQSLEVWR